MSKRARGRPIVLFCPDLPEFRRKVEANTLAMHLAREYEVGLKTIYRWAAEQGLTIFRKPKLAPKWGRGRGSIYTSQGRVWQNTNTPEKIEAIFTPGRLAAFWERVRKLGPDDCWLWTGTIAASRGYGVCSLAAGMSTHAHRVSWMIHNGVIPADLHVLHSCDVRICVNPKHLWLGTNEENMADRDSKKRMPHGIRSGSAKLTEEDVRYIRSSSEPAGLLAKRYGVHYTTVLSARNGKKWRHLN